MTAFEIWDSRSQNVLQFDHLEGAIVALRGLVRQGGDAAVTGLSLDAVSEDGAQRMTLAEGVGLLSLVGVTPKPVRSNQQVPSVMRYQLWDQAAGNMIGDFAGIAGALSFVRDEASRRGPSSALSMALVRVSDDRKSLEPVAQGEVLFELSQLALASS